MTYVYMGDHAQPLSSGRSVAHGDVVKESELSAEDQYLIDDEKLVEHAPSEAPAKSDTKGKATE